MFKVEAAGGAAQLLEATSPAAWPEILPDNKTVLFTTGQVIATISVNGGQSRVLAQTNDASSQGPAVLGTGYILEARLVQPGFWSMASPLALSELFNWRVFSSGLPVLDR